MNRTIIIAEAGVNHNGDINLAKQLVEVAAEARADIVKFQTFKAEKLVSKAAVQADYQISNLSGNANDYQLDMLKKVELNEDMHSQLIEHCKKHHIQFLSTAFDLNSIDFLHQLGLPLFKIPSGEITNLPYLKKIGSLHKEVILSTGMADLGEIEKALNVLTQAGTSLDSITVLHCNTEYPTPMQDVNLLAMRTIAQAFGVNVGYSDHTVGIEVPIAAVSLGARVIEKHFTLDRTMEGPDHKASLEPDELKSMVDAIRNIELALGDGRKRPSPSELKNKEVARKSVHLVRGLIKGHIIHADDLIMKRPGNGISPMLIDLLIGKELKVDLPEDYQLQWNDLL
jgi:N-acetylneuraminate synthase